MAQRTAVVLRQRRAKATNTSYCSLLLFKRAMTCMNVSFGVHAWQPQQINSISMEYPKVPKEIHLSYFCNIIKSSSEYFEYGIIHFPRNQPRMTLGFAWKPTAQQRKCHRAAIPASLLPRGREQEPHMPPTLSSTLPSSSACLKTQLSSSLPLPTAQA